MTKLHRCHHVRCYGAIWILLVLFVFVTSLLRWQQTYRSVFPKPSDYERLVDSCYNETSHEGLGNAFYGYSGSTELKQYGEFVRRNPKFVLKLKENPQFVKLPVDYRITVSVICGVKPGVKCDAGTVGDDIKRRSKSKQINESGRAEMYQNEGVFISITERHNADQKCIGGSSFRVMSTTPVTRQLCSYVDMFDCTYVAWCPLSFQSECSNLSVSLDFFNFTAYTGNNKPLRDVKWRQTICREQLLLCGDDGRIGETVKTLLRRTDLAGLQSETARRNAVTWQRQNDRWRARLSWQKDQLFEMNQTKLCKRLKRLDRVILIGASHMRYKSDHIIIQCYKMPIDVGRKHTSMAVGNIEYIRKLYAKEFKSIPAELSKRNLTKGDLVLIQTGAYDMFKSGLQKSLAIVPVFSQVLREIRDLSRRRGFRVVFVTSPSYPRRDSRNVRGSRNNFALAAFNGSMKRAMADIGVEIFDEFSAFLAYEEEAICGAHYLCRLIGDLRHVSGELGKTAAELLFAYATI